MLFLHDPQCSASDMQPDPTQQFIEKANSQRIDQDGFYESAGALLQTSSLLEDNLALWN